MYTATQILPTAWPVGRLMRWIGFPAALIAFVWAAWYIGVKLPERRESDLRVANSLMIPGLNLDMVWIAPGTFLMGTPEQQPLVKWFYTAREKFMHYPNPGNGEDDERPATLVKLTQPFWLGRTAVTQRQYEQLMGMNPSNFKVVGLDAPVENVSWTDAMMFCQKLTEREMAAGRLPAGYAYTLPTEAQREYACRAGTDGAYAGNLDAMAWYQNNCGARTHPVGMKESNAWGLFDMEGNVLEWCRDWYQDKLPGGEVTNPRGPTSGTYRVLRGGCWSSDAARCRSASRIHVLPEYHYGNFGFRLALSAVP